MARVTVKALAAAVGVSPATVSNAYNRPDQLSAELRERIFTAASELGFTGPDAAGRALRVGRADAVGVLLSDRLSYAFSDPYAVGFLTGLSEIAEDQRISVVLVPLGAGMDLTAVSQVSIDALAMLSLPGDHPAARLARARGVRIVGTDASPDPDASWVAIDDVAAGRSLGEHLTALGHRDATVVVSTARPAGSPAHSVTVDDVVNLDGVNRVAGLAEVLPGTVTLISGGHHSTDSGVSAGRWIAAQPTRPTAVVCLGDALALGLLDAFAEHGIDVPGEVSVTGFDDVPGAATAGLTTVRQPIGERGRTVGRLLIDPTAQPRQVVLPTELVIRTSTGPARS